MWESTSEDQHNDVRVFPWRWRKPPRDQTTKSWSGFTVTAILCLEPVLSLVSKFACFDDHNTCIGVIKYILIYMYILYDRYQNWYCLETLQIDTYKDRYERQDVINYSKSIS